MREKLLFVTDLDGTLIRGNADGTDGLSADCLNLINAFKADGHIFAIATARPSEFKANIDTAFGFLTDFIGSNGADIIYQDKSRESAAISHEEYSELYAFTKANEIDGTLVLKLPPGYYSSWLDCYPYTLSSVGLRGNRKLICNFQMLDERIIADHFELYKILFLVHPDDQNKAQRKLQERYGDKFEIVQSDFDNLDITKKGCTKGNAIRKLAKRYGIKKDNIISIGDSENDISMFRESFISFAMNEADDDVKENATYCIESVEAALNRIIEMNKWRK